MDREEIKKRLEDSPPAPIMSNSEKLGFQVSTQEPIYRKPWFKGVVLLCITTSGGLIMWATGGQENTYQMQTSDAKLQERLEELEAENSKLKGIHVASLDRETLEVPTRGKKTTRTPQTDKSDSKPSPKSNPPSVQRTTSQPRRSPPPPTRVVRVSSAPRSQVPPAKPAPKPSKPAPKPSNPSPPKTKSSPLPVVASASQFSPSPKAPTLSLEEQWLASANFGFSQSSLSSSPASDYETIPTVSIPTDETLQGSYEPELLSSFVSDVQHSEDYQSSPENYQFSDEDREMIETFEENSAKGEILSPIAWAPDFDPTGDPVEIQLKQSFGPISKKATLFARISDISKTNIVNLEVMGYLYEGTRSDLPPGLLQIRAKGGGPLVGEVQRPKRGRSRNLGRQILSSVLGGAANIATDSIPNRELGRAVEGAADTVVGNFRSSSTARSFSTSGSSFSMLDAGTKVEIYVNRGEVLW